MSNLPARSCLPYVAKWLRECDVEPSAAGLLLLRNKADKYFPSKSVFEHAVYHRQLIRWKTAKQVIEIFDFHKPKIANDDQICNFDHRILGFGPLANSKASQRGRSNLIDDIAIAADLEPDVIQQMMKKRVLFPRAACDRVIEATRSLFDVPGNTLKLEKAPPIDDSSLAPLSLSAGRISLLDRLFPDRHP
jgi:hypothetical protein